MSSDIVSFGCFRLLMTERVLEAAGRPIKLGARALDILIILVESAGRIVAKKDLLDRVWPDVTVEEANLRFHVAALRKALGDGEGGARYLMTVPGRGYCFVSPVSRSPVSQNDIRSPALECLERLPRRLTRMIGRAEFVDAMSARLGRDRFVSIVGPGGIGKTTVALAMLHQLADQFDGSVHFFDLGPLNDARHIPTAIASMLGIIIQAEDPTPVLIRFLRDKHALLVLDSCEHVVHATAALAERIFREAPDVHILTTSREPLRAEGEHVCQLPPLASPPEEPNLTAEQVLAFPAVQLFIERVAASGRAIELSDADAVAVGQICRRLDGIPLAIELTAVRVQTYGIRATAALLNQRLSLLWPGRRTALLRHQTLEAMLDWSYQLLSELEKTVLRQLSIFVGVFTLEAARFVASLSDSEEGDVVLAIESLVSKSLLAARNDELVPQFRLLDTTRAYIHEKLVGLGEEGDAARRHACYYLRLLERFSSAGLEASESRGKRCLADHLANIRSALEWSFSKRGDSELASSLAAASASLFLQLSLLTECHRWTEQAIATLGESSRGTRRELKLQGALGLSLMFTRGNIEEARLALAMGLEIAEKMGDMHNQLRLLGRLHIFHERIGDFRGANVFAQRGEAVARRLSDPIAIAEACSALGISCHLEGRLVSARTNLEAAIAEVPDSQRINTFHFGFDFRNRARIALARNLWLEGHAASAVTVARQTIREAEAADHPITLCIALIWAISVHLWVGDLDSAEECIGRFIAQANRHSLAPYQAAGEGVKGELLAKRGDAKGGVRMLRRSLERLHALRYELLTTAFSAALAEGLTAAGEIKSALEVAEDAIVSVDRNGDLFYKPELLRIKGMALSASDTGRAEVCFKRSIDLAREQSAVAWELRSTIDLAKIWAGQDRKGEARILLSAVYDKFVEGAGTVDYERAGKLLKELVHVPENGQQTSSEQSITCPTGEGTRFLRSDKASVAAFTGTKSGTTRGSQSGPRS
jgi:predicted ATPase/DNA-binding winged helix-turn-helix (wHTH) protein